MFLWLQKNSIKNNSHQAQSNSGLVVESQLVNLASGVQGEWTNFAPGAGPQLHNRSI